MLNATLTKNATANGFELRLHEQVDKKVWDYLCNEMGMNWVYSKTEKTADGKRQVILYRSFDKTKPQNKRKTVKFSPERAYEILMQKTVSALADTPSAQKPSKTRKVSASKAEEPKAKSLDKMTKAELIALITASAESF